MHATPRCVFFIDNGGDGRENRTIDARTPSRERLRSERASSREINLNVYRPTEGGLSLSKTGERGSGVALIGSRFRES